MYIQNKEEKRVIIGDTEGNQAIYTSISPGMKVVAYLYSLLSFLSEIHVLRETQSETIEAQL